MKFLYSSNHHKLNVKSQEDRESILPHKRMTKLSNRETYLGGENIEEKKMKITNMKCHEKSFLKITKEEEERKRKERS